ncbi:SDR family oxidoreductase [Spongiibacter taiwanensis]|uniref:SDR family NAD(P)-dependent oxidoreductase n=1 Tax=Spongiibacter taiwanensis TaxID=1748242 RepID=UPI0020363866|nr:SDR family oxidoreductase [Spongiibacter taiwanensis]USA44485.1 SDR family oxidoreductase [Spongiibacter taiwanensis]
MSDSNPIFCMQGKIAVITGAGTGMGKRFSSVLARAGAQVVCVARNLDRLETVAAAIREEGGQAIAVAADLTDAAAIEHIFEQAEAHFGQANVLVNCAAQVDFGGLFPEQSDEGWDAMVSTNLTGAMKLCRSFARRLKASNQSAAIVMVTSITGERVMPGLMGYSSLKAASNHMTKAMARDLFGTGIRVNALSPGYFDTELSSGLFDSEEGRALIQMHPLQRLGRVEELDGPLLLLASDASCHMNGSVVTVDAGHSIGLV